jgi:hypothetical protein
VRNTTASTTLISRKRHGRHDRKDTPAPDHLPETRGRKVPPRQQDAPRHHGRGKPTQETLFEIGDGVGIGGVHDVSQTLSTTIFPMGASAIRASFRCCHANGMPMMVNSRRPAKSTYPCPRLRDPSYCRGRRFPDQTATNEKSQVEGATRPGEPDDRNGKEERRHQPANGHLETAGNDPDNVEHKVHRIRMAESDRLGVAWLGLLV